jgi:hypothetical protein
MMFHPANGRDGFAGADFASGDKLMLANRAGLHLTPVLKAAILARFREIGDAAQLKEEFELSDEQLTQILA